MNKCKSLSDSSTSESEDDGYRHQKAHFTSQFSTVGLANKHSSTSESEDDFNRKMHQPAASFTNTSLMKRKFIVDHNEEESTAKRVKNLHGNFKAPSSSNDLSGSESEDQSPAERSMPSFSNTAAISMAPAPQASNPYFNGIGQHIMEKMGYVSGKGLGKHAQGRTEIVEASKQRGRRGLGLRLQGLEPEDAEWDFGKEEESLEEEVAWLPRCTAEPPDTSELRSWSKIGKKERSIENQTEFCDPDVLQAVLACKNVFDSLEPEEMRKARTRSNPYETIRGGIFLNRAAMKMANIDSRFGFMFTEPKDENGDPMVNHDELLYFADICAGPGGFSEYILWRKKWHCKGFGFTLKGANDFKLDEFLSGPPETFEPHYGVRGVDGNGDIYIPDNLEEFQRFVLANTENEGVHFVMADGGFSVEGEENLQEILSKRLYLCQFLCALMIIRNGGHFLCKLFDTFTPFSIGLIYLMYRSFEKVCIHKPNTSRPANSERYIICKWRKQNAEDVCQYLFGVNEMLEKFSKSSSKDDVTTVVPLDLLKGDEKFFEYMMTSNNVIGARQVIHLNKIRAFAKNTQLHDERQSDFRKQCLKLWNVPDKARSAPTKPEPEAMYSSLMRGVSSSFLTSIPEPLTIKNMEKLNNVFDLKCVVCGELAANSYLGFFLGLGRSNICRLDAKNCKWVKIEVSLELPSATLFYGELIPELKGEAKAQRKMMCLHIIDALFLGGKDVRSLHYEDRMNLAIKFSKAVSKPSRADYTPLKVKKQWPILEVNGILNRLVMKNVKGYGGMPRLCFDMEDGRHIIPSGLLIFRTTASHWVTAYSKSQRKIYYFNTKEKNSATFERVKEVAADFMSCLTNRMFWSWEKGVQLLEQQPRDQVNKSVVHSHILWEFLRRQFNNITGLDESAAEPAGKAFLQLSLK